METQGQVIMMKHKSEEIEHSCHSYGFVFGILIVVLLAAITGILWKMSRK